MWIKMNLCFIIRVAQLLGTTSLTKVAYTSSTVELGYNVMKGAEYFVSL
jgi:hypothetical protein